MLAWAPFLHLTEKFILHSHSYSLPAAAAAFLLFVIVDHLAIDYLHPRMELEVNLYHLQCNEDQPKNIGFSGRYTNFSVVQEVGCGLQAAEGDHAGSGADHEVVGVGVAALLLSLRPDCPRQ